MADNHPFTVKIAPCPKKPGRFQWQILEGEKQIETSFGSYATAASASAAGMSAMESIVRGWRARQ